MGGLFNMFNDEFNGSITIFTSNQIVSTFAFTKIDGDKGFFW
jgi:hypothetical protein